MDQLVRWISDLLYILLCGIAVFALVILFFDMVIQYYSKGRIEFSKAIGTVSKVLAALVKFVTAGAKRRR